MKDFHSSGVKNITAGSGGRMRCPEWASAERYRHWKGWDRSELGETDHLAERAHQAVGGYLLRRNS